MTKPNLVHQPTQNCCVGAVLLTSGSGVTRVLLGKRQNGLAFYPGVWDLPGGHIEPGETPEQTLFRELHEELGVEPETWRPLGTFQLEAREAAQLTLHLFVVTAWAGRPFNRAPEEHEQIAWFTLEDAQRLVLADPGLLTLLRNLTGS